MNKFYFREKEISILNNFLKSKNQKALAIYGRRRTGKTELILQVLNKNKSNMKYYQVSNNDYNAALYDFKNIFEHDDILDSLNTFKDVFTYLNKTQKITIIIDEFPFLAKKREGITTEFQWIIDHALDNIKLILIGSNRSFMKGQIEDSNSPLYGRFDVIINLLPFSFNEVNKLFKKEKDAMDVYAITGGVAQYVMFFKEYKTIEEAKDNLIFSRFGRLFLEGPNLLNQEVRDATNYNLILRALGSSRKTASNIASKIKMDPKAIYNYLLKLEELNIIGIVNNPINPKKEKRYYITDLYLRFSYSFIDSNVSMISALGPDSKKYILDNRYDEYLSFIYEDIIRENLYTYANEGYIPFMPNNIGNCYVNVFQDGKWFETEIDVIGINGQNVIIGECKYKNKKIGINELKQLQFKANFLVKSNQNVFYMLASNEGFTKELLELNDKNLLLIHGTRPIK